MIDPSDVTKYNRTNAELEEWWLFGTVVAGKTATTQARALQNFFDNTSPKFEGSPFQIIRTLLENRDHLKEMKISFSPLRFHLEKARLGQYSRLEKCWEQSLSLDLKNDPLEAFEAIHGIGPKTARMFLLHSRPNQRYAALDTHLLKFLNSNGYPAPPVTPGNPKQYRALEIGFLNLADKAGMTPADFDLQIWKSYTRGGHAHGAKTI